MYEESQHYKPTPMNSPGRAQSYAQGRPVYIVQAKSTLIAYLLLIFLWWLGAHKFYLRQPFMGLFYLVGNLIASGMFALVPFIGWIFYVPIVIVALWDLFTIPVRVRFLNMLMGQQSL